MPPPNPQVRLLWLPPILRSATHAPMASCSQAPRGLFVLLRVGRIFTALAISPSSRLRQRPDRSTFRAGRNLPDKEFRYLRTVIVTAAVYWGFGSPLAQLPLTFQHWAGVSRYTSAVSRSHRPVFLLNSRLGLFAATRFSSTRAGFTIASTPFPEVTGSFVPSSLTGIRSSTLVSSTCLPVSVCGTGTPSPPCPSLSRLPRSIRLANSRKNSLVLASRSTDCGICHTILPTSVNDARLVARTPHQHLSHVQTFWVWSPIINGVSISYGSRPRLRPDFPAAECPCGGTLRLSVEGVLTPRIVTHTDIRTCGRSTGCASAPASTPPQRSPTIQLPASRASVIDLAPVDCRCNRTKPVSCYALFQGWLLLSQPPGCLRPITPLPTEPILRDLSGGSGLLPS